MKRIFVLLILFLNGLAVYTQNDKRQLLVEQLGEYLNQYYELSGTRGVNAKWYHGVQNIVGLHSPVSHSFQVYAALGGMFLNALANDYKGADVVFYHLKEDKLYCWLIHEGFIEYETVKTTKEELSILETTFKQSIENGNAFKNNSRGAEMRAIATDSTRHSPGLANKQLSAILFPQKIATLIKSKKNIFKHVIIIPELNIASIPLYLLQPFEDSSMLIDHVSMAICPSLDELVDRIYYYSSNRSFTGKYSLQGLPIKSNFNLSNPLIVGSPDYSGCETAFDNLPGVELEVNHVALVLGTKPLLKKNTTKKIVLDRAKKSNFIYFATHGIADTSDPLHKSSIVLTGNQTCDYLTAMEIQNTPLRKETMVILSACRTGLGQTMSAGVIGLSRAFTLAGASNVLVSLWNVNDQATKDLMKITLQELMHPSSFFPQIIYEELCSLIGRKIQTPSTGGLLQCLGPLTQSSQNSLLLRQIADILQTAWKYRYMSISTIPNIKEKYGGP